MLLSASVERFGVSQMRDFLKDILPKGKTILIDFLYQKGKPHTMTPGRDGSKINGGFGNLTKTTILGPTHFIIFSFGP